MISEFPSNEQNSMAKNMLRVLLIGCILLTLCHQARPTAVPNIPGGRAAFQFLASVRRRIVSFGRKPRASALVDASASDGPKWQQFAEWARARGILFEKWQVGDVGGGLRGAIATEDVKLGSVLVSAPPDAVLSVREADACPLPRSFIDPAYWNSMSKKWEMRMALLLLYEKKLGTHSSWAPYLDVLPQSLASR